MEGKLHKRNTKIKRVKTTQSDTSIQGRRQHTSSNVKQNSPNETWYRIQDILRSAAHTAVGTQERHQQNREPSKQISELSRKQKELRIKSQNTMDEVKKAELKKERNKVLHDIEERESNRN